MGAMVILLRTKAVPLSGIQLLLVAASTSLSSIRRFKKIILKPKAARLHLGCILTVGIYIRLCRIMKREGGQVKKSTGLQVTFT